VRQKTRARCPGWFARKTGSDRNGGHGQENFARLEASHGFPLMMEIRHNNDRSIAPQLGRRHENGGFAG
jgi:hypothetical protein